MTQHDDKAAARRQKLERQYEQNDAIEIDNAVQQALATRPGRRFLWSLLQMGMVGGQPYASNDRDTSFNCGQLNVGNQILALIISADPGGFMRMQQENAIEQRERNGALGRDEPDPRSSGPDLFSTDDPNDSE